MPLNLLDAHYRSFGRQVLPRLVERGIGVLGMKSMAEGHLLKTGTVTPIECLHYALDLPTSVVITGIDSLEILDQALEAVRTFRPLTEERRAALLAKTAAAAAGGKVRALQDDVAFRRHRRASGVARGGAGAGLSRAAAQGSALSGATTPHGAAALAVSRSRPMIPVGVHQRGSLMKRMSAGSTVVLALLVTLLLAVLAAPAGATLPPGHHAWFGSVYSTSGTGDESAVAVAVDSFGRAVVVGSAITSAAGDLDIRCSSWATDGFWRWTSVENSWDNPANPAADDIAAGVVVDDVRTCLYVAGTTQGLTTGKDIVLLKVGDGLFGYLPGEVVWAKTARATVGQDDEAEAVAMDKAGNVYVTGGAERADGTMDVITVKYLPDGTVAWTKSHNNAGARFDRGLAIAVYGSSVYVAGLSNRRGHGDDLVLLKYTTGGERKWVRYYDDPLNRHESVTGIAVSGTAVYVCGSGKATATKPGDALLVKFRPDGTTAWARWSAGSAGGDDGWNDVAIDAKGRAHVTGYHKRSGTGTDIVTAMYSTAGAMTWGRGYSMTGKRPDVGTGLAVDADGRTYVSGWRTGSDGDLDWVALKYGTTGTTLWTTSYPDPVTYPVDPFMETDLGDDMATDVALSSTYAFVVGDQVWDHGGAVPDDGDLTIVAIAR